VREDSISCREKYGPIDAKEPSSLDGA